MEPIIREQNWENQKNQKETKHDEILEKLYQQTKNDPNTLGFLVIGSVARRTHTPKSDIDVITILRNNKPSSGINQTTEDGIIIDSLYFTFDVLTESVNTVPYLLHTLVDAKILYDSENTIKPLIESVKEYYKKNPEIENEWKTLFESSKKVKEETGCRANAENGTIIDVWNLLEKRYSGGKSKRPFFNAFYLTNPTAFNLLKKTLGLRNKVKGEN